MKKTYKKLKLSKETILQIGNQALNQVNGAGTTTSIEQWVCDTSIAPLVCQRTH